MNRPIPMTDRTKTGEDAMVERVARMLSAALGPDPLRTSYKDVAELVLNAAGVAALQQENQRLAYDNGNLKIRCRHLLSCLDKRGDLDREDALLIEATRASLQPVQQS